MVALIVALAFVGPPKATLSTASATVPLALSSWCWSASLRRPVLGDEEDGDRGTRVARDRPVRVRAETRAGRDRGTPGRGVDQRPVVSWAAARGGGVTIHATGPRGWVTYVGRLKVLLEKGEDGAAAGAVFFVGSIAPTPGAPPHRARQRSVRSMK